MSIKKQFLKTKASAKISFKVSKVQAAGAQQIAIVGDFNDWNPKADLMKALKDGSFSHNIELPVGTNYEFRYLADNSRWFNEEEADALAETSFVDAQNSVIVL
ncbi:MAG: isoamylase early set domain-containing protein [Bacteroidales bacterium]|nr:isoamylase early set domain-containing protein [Bacteroidales bacterium]